MTDTSNNSPIHDSFIKQAMAKPKVAREFFESFLPAHVMEKVDLSTLEPQKDSFIENTLGSSYVDMLYKVKFGEEEGYLYVLLEQQSKPDRFMAFRLHKYMHQICSNHLEKHSGVKYLPLVYPLVFYTGQAGYNAPLTLWELFKEPELAKSFFIEPFQLVELHKIDDEELRKHVWSGTMAFIMKHIFERDIFPFLKEIEPLLKEIGKENIIYIENVLWYILEKAESNAAETVVEFFKEIVPEEKRVKIMSIADTLIEKGVQKGVQLGKQEGIQLGEQRGIQLGKQEGIQLGEQKVRKIVLNMLAKGQSTSFISEVTGLSEAEIQKIAESKNNTH